MTEQEAKRAKRLYEKLLKNPEYSNVSYHKSPIGKVITFTYRRKWEFYLKLETRPIRLFLVADSLGSDSSVAYFNSVPNRTELTKEIRSTLFIIQNS